MKHSSVLGKFLGFVSKNSKKYWGFTLVELMVVISIIGVLSVIGVSKFSGANKSSGDLRKKADIDNIAKAYEINFNPATNQYKTLGDGDFSSRKIPIPPNGGTYSFVTGPNVPIPTPTTTKIFTVCAQLGTYTGTCTISNTNCYCKSSAQDVKPTPTLTITPIPTLTPTPTIGPTTGLLSFWKMDETNGTAVSTSFGSNIGTSTSSINIGPSKTGLGNARTFDGTQYITTSDSTYLNNLSAISISAWFKTTYGFNEYIIAKDNNAVVFARINIISNSSDFWINDRGQSSNTVVNDGNWHHVVGTYNGSTMSIYIDGILKGSSNKTGLLPASSTGLYIGTREGLDDKFHGSIDAVGIWNRALSLSEVQALYNNGNGVQY